MITPANRLTQYFAEEEKRQEEARNAPPPPPGFPLPPATATSTPFPSPAGPSWPLAGMTRPLGLGFWLTLAGLVTLVCVCAGFGGRR